MKVISNTLKPVVERWDDPGDYPSGAGSGPLPSHDYVAYIDGQIVVEFVGDDLDVEADETIEDWLSDNAGEIDHGIGGLTVKEWLLKRLEVTDSGDRATLEVQEFECDVPEPPEREYDPMDEIERRERREKEDMDEARLRALRWRDNE
jgi:hypothetical protein